MHSINGTYLSLGGGATLGDVDDYSFSTFGQIASITRAAYVANATTAMSARFTHFTVTPQQLSAWEIGFEWIHDTVSALGSRANSWLALPEFAAPLVSGRPDLVIVTPKFLIVIEMKTGVSDLKTSGQKQVLTYASTLWGKLKAARNRTVIPVLLSSSGRATPGLDLEDMPSSSRPEDVLALRPSGLNILLSRLLDVERGSELDAAKTVEDLLYSPRPSIVEAATSLIAATEDKNVITGLSGEDELTRISSLVQAFGIEAMNKLEHRVVVVAGPPGAGKTIVGLRLAHDPEIQNILPDGSGTPLYLTGNGPLVEVLVETLARDDVRRTGKTKALAKSHADAKVRLIHGITEKRIGIESNVIVFDEGQRIWTEERMRTKKGDTTVGSEAEEILSYLESKEWALVVVLLGEGQEINDGEAGIITWLEAVQNRASKSNRVWRISTPDIDPQLVNSFPVEVDPGLRLKVVRRTDNAADVSSWAAKLLDLEIEQCKTLRRDFPEFPIMVTRSLEKCRSWLRSSVSKNGGTSGLLASAQSKRLFKFGVDVASDPNRSFKASKWYLDTLPDLQSSEALEIAVTEFKSQGLELDWVGVCWSWDLVPGPEGWLARTLDSARGKWNKSSSASSVFRVNAYRVLLTRSRKGMVIWVPEGVDGDETMDIAQMDKVAELLQKAGATLI